MKKVLIFAIICLFVFTQFTSAMKVEEINPTDYVTDYTGTLSSEEVLEISKILGTVEKEKGYQIGVVMIDKMEDEYGNADYIEHFAVKLFQKLGLGTKEKDEGMLWLISKDDRQMRMEVGYGLESVLTDGVTKNIQDNFVRPEFKNNNYFAGIKLGTELVSDTVLGKTEGAPLDREGQDSGAAADWGDLWNIIIILFVFGINILGWLFAIMARTKSWWLGGVATFAIGFPILFFGFGLNMMGDLILFVFTLTGFLFDYFISRDYKYWQEKLVQEKNTHGPDWWAGGTWGPGSDSWTNSSGSGFGGFGGGGMSGGGGSSSSW
jgi:uncharacterized protein